jgi:hypothetical protein
MKSPGGPAAEHYVTIGFALAAVLFLMLAGCASVPPAAVRPHVLPSLPPPRVREAAPAQDSALQGRLVQVPVDRARLAGRPAELWFTSDRGQNWIRHGEVGAAQAAAAFLAPGDGRYGFLFVAAGDAAPKPGDAPAHTVVVDAAAPVVEVLSPNGGEVFGTGRTTVIQWVAKDANLAPAGIRIDATTGGEDWITIAKELPNTGSYHWDIGLVSSARCRVRVVATDLAGNAGMDASDREFTVDGLAPDVRAKGPASAASVPALIDWTGGDLGGAGLKRVSLYVTKDDGRSWRHAGDDEDLKSPFPFTDLDGVYGLRFVAEDRMGNANPVPVPGMPALTSLVIDRTKPELRLLSPASPGYVGGLAVDVQWTARDAVDLAANAVSLHYSADGGKTWKEIARGLPNDGSHKWTPPREPGTDYRLKASATDFAGNAGEAVSGRFGIDAAVPQALATGPDRSGSHSVQVTYEIKDRGTVPVKRVTLWYRPENVQEWIKHGDDPDAQSPFLFAKADGKYGIYVACATEQGAAQKEPDAATEAQLTLTIDATPPQVWLDTFGSGGFFMAGAATDIAWKILEPNPDPRGLSILHSPDGGATWSLVASGVDSAKGVHRWTVPNSAGNRHKLRLETKDLFGNRGTAESEKPFTIDNELPMLTLKKRPPSVSRSSRVAVEYKAQDLTSGVDRVALHGKPVEDKGPYRLLAFSRNVEGTLEADLPAEGTWAFLVVAQDAAGHLSADPDRAVKADFAAAWDKTKPEISIRDFALPQGGRTWLSPAWELEWKATDGHSPPDAISIRIEWSGDGGRTWFVAVPRHHNSGKADLRAWLLPGKRYQVRLVAVDEAENEAAAETPSFDPGDVPPPALALRGIEEGRSYPKGSTAALVWASPDKTIREADLQISQDGGRTWSFLGKMSAPSLKVPLPEKEGPYHLRVTARDSMNRPVSSNFVPFTVVAGVEPVRLIASPAVEAGRLMRVIVEPKSIVRAAQELRLEISEDDVAWRKLADVRIPDLQIVAPAVAGEYHLRLFVKGADGKEFDSNHLRIKVTSGDGASGIRLLNFRGGEVYPGGRGAVIGVKTPALPAELEVEFSEDSGRTWRAVSRDALVPVSGGLHWRPLPPLTKATCRLRVKYRDSGGQELKDESDKDFAIDSQKPLAAVAGPADGEAPVTLQTRVDVSISPVRELVLYVSEDGGRSWRLHQTHPAQAAVAFAPLKAGDYGLFLVARSEAGLAGDPPAAGTAPQAVVKVRARGGAVELPPAASGPVILESAFPPALKGGTSFEVRWSSKDPAGKATLSLLTEAGTLMELAKDQPASGSWSWPVPKADHKGARIVVRSGEHRAESRVFDIDASAPQVERVLIEPRK